MRVARADPTRDPVVYGARAHDQQVAVGDEPIGDLVEETAEVLEASLLTRRLRATATVAYRRIVADVADGPVARRHVGHHPDEVGSGSAEADDHGLSRVDPDQGQGTWQDVVDLGRWLLPHHAPAHAGVSVSTARSA
jgi:hypothetical protein